MEREELIQTAWRFLQPLLKTDIKPPVSDLIFEPAGQATPYDRWLVVFLTHPDWQPCVSVVEIRCPEMEPSLYPMI